MKRFPTLPFLAFLLLTLVSLSGAQTKSDELTWGELKQVQVQDRALLDTRQKEDLLRLSEMQKALLEKGVVSDVQELAVKFNLERREIAKLHSEERTKLAQIQAEERKAFINNKPSKSNDVLK